LLGVQISPAKSHPVSHLSFGETILLASSYITGLYMLDSLPERLPDNVDDAVCLSKDELQRTSGEFRVACDRQKTGTHVSNWIPTWLGQELLKVKNGNPEFFFWSGLTTPEDAPSYFQKLYRKVFKAAGVEGSSHNFRHTYAVELLKSGVDIRTVSKALGHKSLQVTERFYAKWNRAQQDKMDDTLRTALG
jgi:integrase/recombinase XerD